MTNPQALQNVREALSVWLQREHPGESFRAHESILIRDGFYCGRRFVFSDYQAVWFVEEKQVKIYSAEGELICGLLLGEQPRPMQSDVRRAA